MGSTLGRLTAAVAIAALVIAGCTVFGGRTACSSPGRNPAWTRCS